MSAGLSGCFPFCIPKLPGATRRVSQASGMKESFTLPSLTTLRGFPCCVRFPCVHAVATTPAQQLGALLRSFPPSPISLPRKGDRVGLRIVLFEACSAFTRVTACTLTLSPIRDTLYPKASAISLPP